MVILLLKDVSHPTEKEASYPTDRDYSSFNDYIHPSPKR